MNKPTYTENPNETDTKHNSKTKEALSLLSENPELQDVLRDKLDGILKRVMDDISRQSVEMSNTMLAYGVRMCPEVAAVWLSGQFQKQAALLNEYYAGIAIAGKDSQANIMRAVDLRQQAYRSHFTQIDEIIEAKRSADSDETEKKVTLNDKRAANDFYTPVSSTFNIGKNPR